MNGQRKEISGSRLHGDKIIGKSSHFLGIFIVKHCCKKTARVRRSCLLCLPCLRNQVESTPFPFLMYSLTALVSTQEINKPDITQWQTQIIQISPPISHPNKSNTPKANQSEPNVSFCAKRANSISVPSMSYTATRK